VVIAEQTEKDIDETRSQYIPVAVRTRILFFCTYDLVSFGVVVDVLLHDKLSHSILVTLQANIDPMYQYSLEWFISIFLNSIANAEQAGEMSLK
jgi:dynein heavy chain